MTDMESRARELFKGCIGFSGDEILDKAIAFARSEVAQARKAWDRELSGELCDPNGAIWEQAKMEKERADKAEAEVERYKASIPGMVGSIQFGVATRQSGLVSNLQARAEKAEAEVARLMELIREVKI